MKNLRLAECIFYFDNNLIKYLLSDERNNGTGTESEIGS